MMNGNIGILNAKICYEIEIASHQKLVFCLFEIDYKDKHILYQTSRLLKSSGLETRMHGDWEVRGSNHNLAKSTWFLQI